MFLLCSVLLAGVNREAVRGRLREAAGSGEALDQPVPLESEVPPLKDGKRPLAASRPMRMHADRGPGACLAITIRATMKVIWRGRSSP
jgi:hypothetical protein